jgi:protein gp37
MNKSKIEWCDYTFNPVSGCLHGCEYCYARRIAKRFGGYFNFGGSEKKFTEQNGCYEINTPLDTFNSTKAPYPFGFDPTFHRYRLDEPSRKTKPQKIFVCSMADLFGEWVPDEWMQEVFKACEAAPQHTYMFLTKNPKRYIDLWDKIPFPTSEKYWYGTTITGMDDTDNVRWLARLPFKHKFLSVEPLLGEISLEHVEFNNSTSMNVLEGCGVNGRAVSQSIPNVFCQKIGWVIIGAQTGPGAKPPKDEWVQSIIDQCRAAGVPVFVKNPLYEKFPIQERPEGMG